MKPPQLESLQDSFLETLLEPIAGDSRERTPFESADQSTESAVPATLLASIQTNADFPASERLELYHRQYWFRIIDSLAEDFPALQRLVGEKYFWKIIEGYLLVNPSRSYTLRHLGEKMAEWLASSEALPTEILDWAIPLAEVEYAKMQSFEAADLPPIELAEAATAKMILAPHIVLRETDRSILPLLKIPNDNTEKMDPESLVRGATLTVVWRNADYAIEVDEEDLVLLPLLKKLQQSCTLDELFAEPSAATLDAETVNDAFQRWQRRAWLCKAVQRLYGDSKMGAIRA